uniref:ubiquitinyl hydrolase 1 n=1 Tax=Globodera rostochiensis TaxID=31243 RepID=A0A914I8D4_GLORO
MKSSKKELTGEQAKRLLDIESRAELVPGHKWYLISNCWWTEFVKRVEAAQDSDIVKMEPIDNSDLVDQMYTEAGGFELKPDLHVQVHIFLLPEKLFTRLKEAYGVALEERDEILREVITGTLFQQEPFIEIYPLMLKVADFNLKDTVYTVPISKADSWDRIWLAIFEALGIQERRSYPVYYEGNAGQLENIPSSVTNMQLAALLNSGTTFYVDCSGVAPEGEQDTAKTTTPPRNTTASSNNGPTTRAYSTRSSPAAYSRGLCGLQNLGNTCFMNSALQCLSNVPELTEYFLRGAHIGEVNEDNPLGTQGRLVKEYAELLKEMWSGECGSVRPFKLKCVIGEFAPRFNGHAQHDSQELTAFLLDGLHEDLNRIKKKPYVEEKEVDGQEEAQAAIEAWEDYRKRNDSIIVDLLHGQLKSTLTCNMCSKVSVKFDPFCFLSVPIPARERQVKSVVVFVRVEKWAKFVITHTTKTTAAQLKQVLREQLQLAANTQVVILSSFYGGLLNDDSILAPSYQSYARFYAYTAEPGPILLIDNVCYPFCNPFPPVPVPRPAKLTRRVVLTDIVPRVRELCMHNDASGMDAAATSASSSTSSSFTTVAETSSPARLSSSSGTSLAVAIITSPSSPSSGATGSASLTPSELSNGHTYVVKDEQQQQATMMESDEGPFALPMPINIELVDESRHKKAFPQELDEEVQYAADGPPPTVHLTWDSSVKNSSFNNVDINELVDREVNMSTTLKKCYTLKECIELYTQREQLNEEDSWYCPNCKTHQRAFKKLDLWSLPQILVIHLKRFTFSRYTRDKIETELEIPVRGLDLNDKVMNPAHPPEKYELIGISNHSGGLGSGHYTACALNGTDWCEFNDSSAVRLGHQMPDVVNSREAYMLVYRRCQPRRTVRAVERGLLDEQDIELLEQDDDDNNKELDACQESGGDDHHQHGAVRQQQLLAAVIVSSVVAVACGGCLFAFASFCVLFTAIAALFVLFLPRLAFWLWTRRVDERFRHFVLALRQRELALFGLKHPPLSAADGSTLSSSTYQLPFRTQRIRCLRQLCQFVHAFNGASTELVSTSNERDSLLFNFVGDEMRTLSSEEQTEPNDDNNLHTNALKSLWQYHFLVRSEFIRVALLALRRDLFCCRRLAFCHHLTLILNIVRLTVSLRVDVGRSTTTKTVPTKLATNSTGGRLSVSSLAICRAQLEWALERLEMLEPTSVWPPPLDVIKCVEQVAASFRHTSTTTATAAECQRQSQTLPEGEGTNDRWRPNELMQCQTENSVMPAGEENDDDYQIFELDIAEECSAAVPLLPPSNNSSNNNRTGRSVEQEEAIEECSAGVAAVATRDAMLRELGAALTRRKELCLSRERRALARARGVPAEALADDELERTPFADGQRMVAGKRTVPPPSSSIPRGDDDDAATAMSSSSASGDKALALHRGVTALYNGTVAVPTVTVRLSADAVAAQRAAILGSGTALVKMEQFGEDADDEK